jgi:hypothetical protein
MLPQRQATSVARANTAPAAKANNKTTKRVAAAKPTAKSSAKRNKVAAR